MPEQTLSFGPFVLDRSRAVLLRDGKPLAIGQRGFALLEALLEAEGGVVAKADLMERAWPGTIVEEGNLTVQMAALRKALGTQPDGQDWIATVPRVGYRLPRPVAAGALPEAVPTGRPSIAVLPFANLSSDAEQAFFADGVVEDLITALSRFKTFAVVARNSVFSYKGRAVDVREVAKELGVRYVLEGSVRRSDKHVRVSAQLIDAASGAHLWAQKFDGTLEDIFDFQDRITEEVIGLIEPQIRKAEIERARRKRPESLDAYELYLRALPMVYSVDVPSYSEAIVLLERAIALDPDFAPALALAAWAHEKRWTFGTVPPGVDDAAEAIALAHRALAADSDDAMVLAIVGWLFILLREDYEAGLTLHRRALELNPNGLLVLNFAGLSFGNCGDIEEGIACHSRALQLSPGAPDNYWSLTGIATGHFLAKRFDEAITWAMRSLETYNAWEITYLFLISAYAMSGRIAEAKEAVAELRRIKPGLAAGLMVGRPGRFPERNALIVEGLRRAGMTEFSAPQV